MSQPIKVDFDIYDFSWGGRLGNYFFGLISQVKMTNNISSSLVKIRLPTKTQLPRKFKWGGLGCDNRKYLAG